MYRKTLATAVALSALTLAGTTAIAQTTPAPAAPAAPVAPVPSQVVVFDISQIAAGSALGQDMNNKLQAIQNGIQAELQTEVNALQAERQRLGAVPTAQTGTAEFQGAAERLQLRERELANKLRRVEAELQATGQYAESQFVQLVRPVVDEVMRQRGALVSVEIGSTAFTWNPGIDITTEVINRLNATVRTMNVQRLVFNAEGQLVPMGGIPAAPATPAATPGGQPLPRAPQGPAPRN